jgi:hypothetical protein
MAFLTHTFKVAIWIILYFTLKSWPPMVPDLVQIWGEFSGICPHLVKATTEKGYANR